MAFMHIFVVSDSVISPPKCSTLFLFGVELKLDHFVLLFQMDNNILN